MKIHLISLSPSCFVDNLTLKATIKTLEYLFHHTILVNYQDFYSKMIDEYRLYLDHNRVKDFELLLLMYSKEKRIVEIGERKNQKYLSQCQLNKDLFKQGITILHSKDEMTHKPSVLCGSYCFMTNEVDYDDLLAYKEQYPVPPSQEIRLERSHNSEWMEINIYNPLLTCSKTVQIVDPFIGRELKHIANVNVDKWLVESQWVYSLTEIFKIFKEKSLYVKKDYSIHTAVRIDEENDVVETVKQFRKNLLQDPNIEVKFFLYIYEKATSPPEEFPHDRYVLTDSIGVNIGIGIDTIDPDNKQVRRETQLTVVGINTVASVKTQLKNLPEALSRGKKRRIFKRRTI